MWRRVRGLEMWRKVRGLEMWRRVRVRDGEESEGVGDVAESDLLVQCPHEELRQRDALPAVLALEPDQVQLGGLRRGRAAA